MSRAALSSEFDSSEPTDYEPLRLDDLEKVSRVERSPAGRWIIDSNDFLLEFRKNEVKKTRGFFNNDAEFRDFYEAYLRSSHINQELAGFLYEASRTPQQIQQEIQSLNELIERRVATDPFGAEEYTSLKAFRHRQYMSTDDELFETADHYTNLIETSELDLWMIARKNRSNKDAVAMQLKAAKVIDFGGGKALRPVFLDKYGKAGTMPKNYVSDPQLHTPV